MQQGPQATDDQTDSSRNRFLDAADRLFIREGYDRCTIRAISAEAKTSLALLSRHWGSKKRLFHDVFKRHFDPIHVAQQAHFDALETQENYDLRAILEAFFSPALRGNIGPAEERISHMVYCAALRDPSDEARSISRELMAETRGQLIGLLRKALPNLDEVSFFLAFATVLGAYVYPQITGGRVAEIMGVDFAGIDWQQASSTIASYLEDGLRQANAVAGLKASG